jgi:DNA-binding NarL/FixJ family response regulator
MNIRILIVGNNPLARMGLAALLAEREEFEMVGQVAADDHLGDAIAVHRPDVLLWDTGWELNGERLPEAEGLPMVALLADSADAPDAWQGGARAILPPTATADQIAVALQAVIEGLVILDRAAAQALIAPLPPAAPLSPLEALTPREQEVLQLLAQGLANKIIAQRLEISEHTVKFHVNAIMTKLGAQSRTEAVVRATQRGLIIL